jgi:hypothetical protein
MKGMLVPGSALEVAGYDYLVLRFAVLDLSLELIRFAKQLLM